VSELETDANCINLEVEKGRNICYGCWTGGILRFLLMHSIQL